ncbi:MULTISPECIES: DUF58 domain-containing protein [unclassified Massilia]|uniref:DUF58 domain-containing protein n=1 Tax=unclassified Massilia TaxID=2609279 RepID=UPI00177EF43C|nr:MULTISPECIES: DUF58 domain-containing protein [unclassified Massilia]MBD8531316.1 DUF58 domain-containing protein [Massilia sp. CFBP 13647]MBD8675954.1 DUF58 domain-containing protein [Massilia sp. CFBP 13721]
MARSSLTRRLGLHLGAHLGKRKGTAVDKGELLLGQRRIYILPTGPGLGFGALLLVLLIGSINYNLGLGYALTFLALSCAVVDMLLTWLNLAYLRLNPVRAPNVFAGQEASFELQLRDTSRRARYAIAVDIAAADATKTGEPRHAVDIPANGSTTVRLALPSETRGWLDAPRLTLSTRFPLGLFRAWSYWRPDARALVYPFPEEGAPPLPAASSSAADGAGHAGEDDFAGVRPYQAGDPLRRLAWRQIARLDPRDGGQLATKHFEGGARTELVLDLAALSPRLDLELRLSRMTRWVLEAESRALPYAFRLGAEQFDAANGVAHQAACLRALALHGLGGAR